MQNNPPHNDQPSYAPPPPQYTQYTQAPPPYQQQPKRKRSGCSWIAIGAVAVASIILLVQWQQAQQASSIPQATSAPATAQPTQALAPADTPMPSTLTNASDIKAELQNDANSALTGDNITADYGERLMKAVIFETTATKQSLSFIQNECFNMQKAVWQDSQLSLKIVDFAIATINGQFPDVYAECVLDAGHASAIDWNNTDATTAWNNKVYQGMTP